MKHGRFLRPNARRAKKYTRGRKMNGKKRKVVELRISIIRAEVLLKLSTSAEPLHVAILLFGSATFYFANIFLSRLVRGVYLYVAED